MRTAIIALSGLGLAACNVTPIEDSATFGPLVQVKAGFTSVLLATPSGGAVLFDASNDSKAKAIEDALQARELQMSDVAHIFVTHSHPDHVKGLAAFPSAQVWALQDEIGGIQKEVDDSPSITGLVHNQIIDAGGVDVRALAVPGHTPGNAAYLVDRVLVMGDSALLDRDGALAPPPERYSDDPAEARASLCALRDTLQAEDAVDQVVFAHSGGLTDPAAFYEMDCAD